MKQQAKQQAKQRKYLCTECHEPVDQRKEPGGLGTWNCKRHPERQASVTKDNSGGKEADRMHRAVAVAVKRHTKVEVVI